MALIKCPECGKKVSSTSDACIHCGYVFDKEKKASSGKKHGEVTLVYRERPGTGIYVFVIVIGVFFVIALIGIILIAVAVHDMNFINKNNAISKDIAYYDYDTKRVIFYSVDGGKISVKPEQISNVKWKGHSLFADCPNKVELGYCSNNSASALNQALDRIKEGTFDD